jgi:hypothetical protein
MCTPPAGLAPRVAAFELAPESKPSGGTLTSIELRLAAWFPATGALFLLVLPLERRLSRDLPSVFAGSLDALLRVGSIWPCPLIWALATVVFPKPGVPGAPGFSSVASIKFHLSPSDNSNGLSSSYEKALLEVIERPSSEARAAESMVLERSTTRSSIFEMRGSNEERLR